jgi:hypothetical protein
LSSAYHCPTISCIGAAIATVNGRARSIEDRDREFGVAHERFHLARRPRQRRVLGQLVGDDVGGHRRQRLQRLVLLMEEHPPVQPEHGGAEQHDAQEQEARIPQRQPCAERERHGQSS